jgi:hypothetical protein
LELRMRAFAPNGLEITGTLEVVHGRWRRIHAAA